MAEDQVLCLECNLDDMTPEALGGVLDLLLQAGALDAWFTPIYMKKNRPGVLLAALSRAEDEPRLSRLLLEHTTTLGVRRSVWQRTIAERESISVATGWGQVRCKLKYLDGHVVGGKPEYDDCARLAREHGLSVLQVMAAATAVLEETLTRLR